ncbi:MAG: hypothetical protein MNSN_05390 [Minisyncoccus archaeiphilus]|uniref:hypothetical protein n=1 Tax=Minisyncoccus archaeiphilus TaxID=3238481 RepID=UPI002B0C00B7|nr:MAG: hypothetical protein MNSN_05390 [Candidatus Parcubacteria bacterium]
MKGLIDKKSKILFIGFLVFTLLIVMFSFYKYKIVNDYYIKIRVGCNPSFESCFVAQCDEGYQDCSNSSKEKLLYYKLLNIKAFNIPKCYQDGSCLWINCDGGKDCYELLCNPENPLEGEICSNFIN